MQRATWLLLTFAVSTNFAFADWPQFRGPGGLGIAPDKNVPVEWSADKNVVWKTELPGAGASSPIVVGDKVFVTSYSGYGTGKKDDDKKNLKRHLLCIERKTGKISWSHDFPAEPGEPAYIFYQALHGYNSSTPVSDGENVYVFHGKSGVHAFDLNGKKLWSASVGDGTKYWGVGASPIIYKDTVIINASTESSSLIALDKKTGKEVWKAKDIVESWNTPVLVKAGSATELAVGTQTLMKAFDPDTGKQLWRAETYNWYVCPSLVAHDGVLYGLQHSICVAVKAGGRGDVGKSHVLWNKKIGHVVSSPLYYDGHVYFLSDGIAHCVKASDGSSVYKERVKGAGEAYASPVLADGKIYYVTRESGTFVLQASPEYKLLAHNSLNDKSIFNASPAVSHSQLILRSDRYLYCIGAAK